MKCGVKRHRQNDVVERIDRILLGNMVCLNYVIREWWYILYSRLLQVLGSQMSSEKETLKLQIELSKQVRPVGYTAPPKNRDRGIWLNIGPCPTSVHWVGPHKQLANRAKPAVVGGPPKFIYFLIFIKRIKYWNIKNRISGYKQRSLSDY